jgi:hypothetical protein
MRFTRSALVAFVFVGVPAWIAVSVTGLGWCPLHLEISRKDAHCDAGQAYAC